MRHTQTTPPPAPTANGNGQQPANGNGNGQVANGDGQHAEKSGFNALLEETQSLQAMLRDALNRTNQLYAGLRQYRRHAKSMQSTLSALRQLQDVEA
jgi:hypothetical protein